MIVFHLCPHLRRVHIAPLKARGLILTILFYLMACALQLGMHNVLGTNVKHTKKTKFTLRI